MLPIVNYPNTRLNGSPILPQKLTGDPAPNPGDIQLSTDNPRIIWADYGSWNVVLAIPPADVGEKITATIKARSASLNIEVTDTVEFNGAPPNVAEKLVIQVATYTPAVS